MIANKYLKSETYLVPITLKTLPKMLQYHFGYILDNFILNDGYESYNIHSFTLHM